MKERNREKKRGKALPLLVDGGRRPDISFQCLTLIPPLFPNRNHHSQVYTASLDGTVRLWAWATGECLETFKVGVPITGMVSLFLLGFIFL